MASSKPATGFISNIQALRFAAASAVLFTHVASNFNRTTGTALAPILALFSEFGWVGVDIFFVISGYVMYVSTQNKNGWADALPFLLKRFARIYFGYWPWLAAFAYMIFRIAGNSVDEFDLWKSVFLLNVSGTMILPVSWTLAYEIQFYAFFAFAMLVSRRLSVFLIALWGMSGLIAGQFWPWIPQWIVTPYTAEFAAGVVLAAYLARFRPPGILPLLLLAILQLLYAMHFFTSLGLPARVLLFGGFACALVASMVALERRGMIAGRWLTLLGGASYTIYLCHVPFIFMTLYLFRDWEQALPSLVYSMLILTVTVFSVFWYSFVELPIYRRVSALIER